MLVVVATAIAAWCVAVSARAQGVGDYTGASRSRSLAGKPRGGGVIPIDPRVSSLINTPQEEKPLEPIDVAADRVQLWETDEAQYIFLTGQAAVLQGVDGLRARQVVIKVTPAPTDRFPRRRRLEIHAEGNARPTGPRAKTLPRLDATLETDLDVNLSPYEPSGLVKLDHAPADPIVARTFPTANQPRAAARTVASRPGTPQQGMHFGSALGNANAAPPVAPETPTPPRDNPPPHVAEPKVDRQVTPSATKPAAPNVPPVVETPLVGSPIETPAAAPNVPPVATAATPLIKEGAGLPEMIVAEPPAQAASTAVAAQAAQVDQVAPAAVVKRDAAVAPVQFPLNRPRPPATPPTAKPDDEPPVELPPIEGAPTVPNVEKPLVEEPNGTPTPPGPGPDSPANATPAPGQSPRSTRPPGNANDDDLPALPGLTPPNPDEPVAPKPNGKPKEPITAPIAPGTQRIVNIYPLNGGPNFKWQNLPETQDGFLITVIRGGVNVVVDSPAKLGGTIDLAADNVVIWRKNAEKSKVKLVGPDGEVVEDAGEPMEIYLEGNVVVRQDERKVQGNGDQKTYRASQVYYDFRTERLVAIKGEVDMYAPSLIAPVRMTAPRIDQYRPIARDKKGKYVLGLAQIHADNTLMTGSRFPNPGYRFVSKSMDLSRVESTKKNPNSGKLVADPNDPNAPKDLTWLVDGRQNTFYTGPVPTFYWPRIYGNIDDLEPPFRQLGFTSNAFFGQMLFTDWNAFKILGKRKPQWIDLWNIDIDYLSLRGPALGTEVGYFGTNLVSDILDPYRADRKRDAGESPADPYPEFAGRYNGYFDAYGIRDIGRDDLGPGPAVVTNGPPGAGKAGYQRLFVPSFQTYRGKITARTMQSFFDEDTNLDDEDFRIQSELGASSDRNFRQQYFKRQFDMGLDQETLNYAVHQNQNTAWSILASGNLLPWNTVTSMLPQVDYYRFGDSLFDNEDSSIYDWLKASVNYSQHSGADYSITQTANEVNNKNLFAYIPYDPVSNTSGTLSTARFYTTHELDAPIKFTYFRLVPYVQGQLVGWNDQIAGNAVGRYWGAVGGKIDAMAWKAYPNAENELFNMHGLNHKINVLADYRNSASNVGLNQIGVTDQIDDNSYEFTRRYFAMTNYLNGVLPAQYDPRFLMLRRALSPISGPTDIQASMQTLHLGIHQRLQTKRGPEGRRRVVDYMTLDLDSTYFPNAAVDNFGKSFGQNMYNWEWYIGDRTSLISYGWFEFWKLGGQPIYNVNTNRNNNPLGLNVITSGISIARPPRANVFIGYTVINTGPINTSALNTSLSYWLSPKWYGTFSNSYDFGNGILLGSLFSFTRIGADYLTTVGIAANPLQNSYTFGFTVMPRISPSVRNGSSIGGSSLDTRYAPVQ